MSFKRIAALIMSIVLICTSFGINISAQTEESVLPEIHISSVNFAKANEICQINVFIYNFDKIAPQGGMYNLRIALPEILSVESVYRDGNILSADSNDYKLSESNILTFSDDFHYDGNKEFAAITRLTVLGRINETAAAGKYDIKLKSNSLIIDSDGNIITFDSENGILRVAAREDCIAGDVDGNDTVDTADMLLLTKSFTEEVTDINTSADSNADGKTDIRDLIFLKKYFALSVPVVYLSENGDDRNCGSQTAPVRTLNKALDLVAHGGTVNITDTYNLGADFKWNHHSKSVTLNGGELNFSAANVLLMADNITFKNTLIKADSGDVFCTGGYLFALGKGASLSSGITLSTDNTPPAAPEEGETDSNTYPTGFPIVKEKETLSVMCVTRADLGDIANSEFAKDYEELTNIQIEWRIYSESAISGAKVLALQSGNMPDIFCTSMTDSEMLQYSKEGAFVEITKDLLKEWAPNIYNTYNKYPVAWDNMTTSDGKMYSLAGLTKLFNYAQHYWFVRTDWLQAIGMKKSDIKTMDDFYDMLVKFKNNDPNGNGQKDEVPLATWSSGGFIFAPWGFNSSIDVDKNGIVHNMYTTSNMKNAVTYWAKVYKEDLVDKKTIDNWAGNNAAFMTLINSGKVGCFWYGWPSLDDALMSRYEALEYPVSGDNGSFPKQAINVNSMVNRGSITITSKCKNVPAALRWIDYLFTNDGYMLKQYGSVGNYYTKTSDTTYQLTGTAASINAGPKWAIRCRDFLDGATITNQTISIVDQRRYAIDDWCEATLKTNGQKFLPTTWKTKEELNAEKLYTTYWNQVSNSWKDFVTGKRNMGADWTTLINEMKAKGINNYIKVLQGYYDRCNN